MYKKTVLYLEDGNIFHGESFGSDEECVGEVVFNTGMTGYQEIITDPSYMGQIVTLTYPEVGNYGINYEDNESEKIYLEGLIVREYYDEFSNFRAKKSLSNYLKENNKVGLTGIDTRKLTKILREKGSLVGVISTKNFDINYLKEKILQFGSMVGKNMVKELGNREYTSFIPKAEKEKYKIAVLDYGCKLNILRELVGRGANVKIFNLDTSIEEISKYKPDGIFVSNGPGDPAVVYPAIDLLKKLLGKYPIFGICLGHQLLGLASNAKTIKLKYGHHGLNHPVMRLSDGRIDITSQNHGFAIDPDSFDSSQIEVTHINLNDNTIEGIRYKNLPVFSVQFHPEAAPGPNDCKYLFNDFFSLFD